MLDPTLPAIRPRSGKSEGACPVCSRIFSLSEISRHAHACANRAYGRAAPKGAPLCAGASRAPARRAAGSAHPAPGATRHSRCSRCFPHRLFFSARDATAAHRDSPTDAGPKAPKKKAREFDNPFDPPDEPEAALGARAEGSDAGRADGAGPSSEPLKAARPKGPKGAAHRGKRGLEQGPFVPRMVKRRRLPATEYWEVERGIVVTCRKLTQETPLFAVVQAARLQQRAGPGAGLSSGPAGRLPLGASCGEAVEPGAGVAAPLPSADYVVPLGGKTGALQSAAAQMRDPALSIAAARRMVRARPRKSFHRPAMWCPSRLSQHASQFSRRHLAGLARCARRPPARRRRCSQTRADPPARAGGAPRGRPRAPAARELSRARQSSTSSRRRGRRRPSADRGSTTTRGTTSASTLRARRAPRSSSWPSSILPK